MSFVSKSRVKFAFNFVYVLLYLGYILFIIHKLLNFKKFSANYIWEEDSKMQEIGEWSLQKDGKMLTYYSWILFEIEIYSSLRYMNPEKWFFLKVCCFKPGLQIVQILTRLFSLNIFTKLKLTFSFKVDLPPDISRFGSNNKLKSPAASFFFC